MSRPTIDPPGPVPAQPLTYFRPAEDALTPVVQVIATVAIAYGSLQLLETTYRLVMSGRLAGTRSLFDAVRTVGSIVMIVAAVRIRGRREIGRRMALAAAGAMIVSAIGQWILTWASPVMRSPGLLASIRPAATYMLYGLIVSATKELMPLFLILVLTRPAVREQFHDR